MTFTTVFDASNLLSHEWLAVAFGLIFVFMGGQAVLHPEYFERQVSPGRRTKMPAGFAWFLLVFATLWTAVAFWATYHGWQKTSEELRLGLYDVTEGPVTQFQPVPFYGKGWEGFTVNGHRFWYSSYIITPGFHQYTSLGGPIRAGKTVRVTYRKNLILKLEVAK